MKIADRLKTIRGKESRESFAPKIGVHAQTLYRYEQGGRDIDSGVMSMICKEFNISPAWILFGEGPMHPGGSTPVSELQPQQPESQAEMKICARCVKLEGKLEKVEQQRDELAVENRQWAVKMEQVLRENGDLRERCAKFEERLACCDSGENRIQNASVRGQLGAA